MEAPLAPLPSPSPLSLPYCQVREVQHRIHELVGIPEQFGESLYVLQYAQGQVRRRGGKVEPGSLAPACRAQLLMSPVGGWVAGWAGLSEGEGM